MNHNQFTGHISVHVQPKMAPQNSTLIHEDATSRQDNDVASVSTVTSSSKAQSAKFMQDLVSNYSPILRPKSAGEHHVQRARQHYYVENVPILDMIVAGNVPSRPTQKKSISNENIKLIKNENSDEEDFLGPYSDYLNSSWYGDDDPHENEDEEQEIPIWIRDEPRFISGITSITTCNDVIAALINDEISNGQYTSIEGIRLSVNDYVITERWRDVESELEGDTQILPLWREWGRAQKEVRFKLKINKRKLQEMKTEKIEKKLDKKEKMTMVTKLMRRVLKQGDYIQKHLFVLKDKKDDLKPNRYNKNSYNKKLFYENYLARNSNGTLSTVVPSVCSSIERLYCKCCGNQNVLSNKKGQKLNITDNLRVRPCPEPKLLENVSLEPLDEKLRNGHTFEDNVRTDDELLLVIENKEYIDEKPDIKQVDNDSGNGSIGKSIEDKHETVESDNSSNFTDPITVTPKRKHKSLRDFNALRKHSLNNRKMFDGINVEFSELMDFPVFDEKQYRKSNKNRADKFDGIRFEIMLKMSEMKQLLIREEMLLTQIQMKCAKYRAENELYNSRMHVADLHVDEIQKNLEVCAQEIIENEHELFRTKLEVEQKANVLHELKTLLEMHDKEEEQLKAKIVSDQKLQEMDDANKNDFPHRRRLSMEKLEFIDDIYEFCDNNKSIII
uniref:CSON005832 protein n=1 Tax=Culicoides sonorensis TaxID=179676 RepID=A0A336LZ73_CULSO